MQKYFKIKHRIPGRVRLKILSQEQLATLAAACEKISGITNIRINPACAALILNYDPSLTSETALLDSIKNFLTAAVSRKKTPDNSCSTSAARKPMSSQLKHFLALSGVMVFVFVKQVLLKKVVIQTAFSPLGLIALATSLPLLKESIKKARQKRFTMEGLLAAGCTAATLSGQALTALEILWIHSGAESLNAWIAERSRRSVSNILDLTAKNTFILVGDVEVEIPVSGVKVRDIVVLHTGEKISVDGEIISGEALVDDSPITGRAELALLKSGDKVFAGSYVHQGIIHVRAECVGDHTYLSRIMKKVEDSIENRAPIESIADNLASNLVRLGFLATLGAFVVTGSLWRAFTVMLVMACPCATALSARTAVSAAMSAAARRGILIKGGRYLEELGKAEVICFDKTGTLTTNEPRIEAICNLDGLSEKEILFWAYSAEVHNQHPLALAIKKECRKRGIDPYPHAVCDFTLGKGVRAIIGNDVIRLGSRNYIKEAGLLLNHKEMAAQLSEKGLTVIYMAKNDEVVAMLAFANETRPDAKQAVIQLRKAGIKKVSVITGDSQNTAANLCRELNIDDCYHSVLPEEKGLIVASLQSHGQKVIMVGDGINDALALAKADIGIAMSAHGSDVAIEAADIALVNDNLADVVYLRELSHKTIAVAYQNFWLATSTNIAGAVAGAMGLLSPVAAGLIHIVHTLGVLANSSRLLLESKNSSVDHLAKKTGCLSNEITTEVKI